MTHDIESQLCTMNALIDEYVKCGSIVDACHIFDNMSERNVVSRNMMILGYVKHKEGVSALELYAQMHQEDIQPNDETFIAALRACINMSELERETRLPGEYFKTGYLQKGRAIHSDAVEGGFESDASVGTTLVHMYVKWGNMDDA